ncbi:hypothetical protein ACHAXR_011224 [Thalassiosira sp. AJA248-18]
MSPASKRSMPKLLLVILNMSHLLLRSTAAKSTINSARSILPSYMSGWPTSRRVTSSCYSANTRALHALSIAHPVGVCKPRVHYVSTLQSSITSVDDDPASTMEQLSRRGKVKKQQTSRKQRRAKSKEANLTRIDKILAHRGVGTRSQTQELAKARRITVGSNPDTPHEERTRIRSPKEKVSWNAHLFLDGKLLPGPPPLLLAYHKPKYVLSVMKDDEKYLDQQRKHLGQMLEPRYIKAGLHPVGRLDYDTTGLILFSLDGALTQRLLHPRRGVEKEYVATVQGLADEVELAKKLSAGVETTEGVHKAKLIAVTDSDGPVDDNEFEELIDIDEDEDEEEMQVDYSGPYSDVRLVVKEGKYRMVRRMLANVGHPVVMLRRLRHGKVELGDLKVGEFREATEKELEWAKSLIK